MAAKKQRNLDTEASGTRRGRALMTRRKILRAAYRLFCRDGYLATTMNEIAQEAGVAVQTVYFTFNTKGALMSEVAEAAVLGFDLWQGPIPVAAGAEDLLGMHPWYQKLRAERNARRALATFIEGATPPLSRMAPLVSVLHAAESEPEVRATLELAEMRRAATWTSVIRIVATKSGGLRRGVSQARAVDIMLILLSAEVFERLLGRGWSTRKASQWLEEVLAQQLLELTATSVQ